MGKQSATSLKINIVALSLAGVLFGYSASVSPVQNLLPTAHIMLASAVVSISAGVAPNPDNTLQKQLLDQKAALDARESKLAMREQSSTIPPSVDNSIALYSFALSLLLLILVGVNFYFDWARSRRVSVPARGGLAIDLRRRG